MDILKKFNVNVFGKGTQPMLFAHGFGCDQHMWRFVVPAFENDYKIILFDYIGHGKSDFSAYNSSRYNTLTAYADDVLEICKALALEDVIYVGHSVSAMVGVLAANKKPTLFDKLIMIGPSPCYINEGDYHGGFTRSDIESLLNSLESNYLGWSSMMAPVIMGNADRPALGEELTNSFCRTNPEIARQFAQVTFLSDNRDDLFALSVPALILQSAEDFIAPVAVGKYVAQQVLDSELVILDANGHCPHLSAPDETVQAIQHYLN